MDNLEKILDVVEKSDKDLIVARENGNCYAIMKLENYHKLSEQKFNSSIKSEDDYALSVKKLIMP